MTDAETTSVEPVDYARFRDQLADPSVTVVDVLPAVSFRLNHIPGAVNLPLAHVYDLAADVLPDKNREIILYCAGFT